MLQSWLIKSAPTLSELPPSSSSVPGASTNKRPLAQGLPESTTNNKRIRPAEESMTDKPIPADQPTYLQTERSNIHPSWYWRLEPEFMKPYFIKLKEFLASEETKHCIFPDRNHLYTWAKVPFDSTKVVILGQDPYHGPGQAHGLSFSVRPGHRIPPSLVNIYTELVSDMQLPAKPSHGHLIGWTNQGVLLLNTVLTVRQGQPNSHQKKGWELFTDQVIKTLNTQMDGLVFILWGLHAQKKGAGISTDRHLVLKAPHPSPLSVHRGGFFGSKPFSKANAYLTSKGKSGIDWGHLPVDGSAGFDYVDNARFANDVVTGSGSTSATDTLSTPCSTESTSIDSNECTL